MKRIDFLKQIALLSAGSAFLPKLKLNQTSNFEELRNGVGIFTMRGGTIGWYTSDDAVVAIDSQFVEPAESFIEGIVGYGDRPEGGPEKVLFNTHHHGDHTSGNPVFAQNGYRIIGHVNVPKYQRISAQNSDSETEPTVPDTTFEKDFELDLGNEKMIATYYHPAHTSGDSVIWFENANVAHMGDLIFNRIYPFIDRGAGAMISGWIDTLEEVISEADSDTLFIFGHGNPEFGVTGNRDDLGRMRDFFSKVLEHTQQGLSAGESREEITGVQSFEEFPDFDTPNNFLSLSDILDVAWRELTESE